MTEFRTFRFCHQHPAYLKIGDKGGKGTKIFRMGKEGTNAAHVHVDVGIGHHKQMSRSMLSNRIIVPDRDLLYSLVSDDLFGVRPIITTHFMDPTYKPRFGVDHPGLDLVPFNRHQTDENYEVYWPLDHVFEVIDIGRY